MDNVGATLAAYISERIRHMHQTTLLPASMNRHSPLDVPELLSGILANFYDDPTYDKKLAPCLVSRFWNEIGQPFLWRYVNMSSVLRLLDNDARFLYDVSSICAV